MSSHDTNKLIRDIRPKLKVNPESYADTTFQALSEKIADDYDAIIKTCVMPSIGETHGLKLRELRVMACLEFYDAPLTPAHIAAMLRYDPATVTRAVAKLEKANMVIKKENLTDTRSFFLVLTETGEALAQLYARRVKTVFMTLESMIEKSMTAREKTEHLTAVYKVSKRTEAMRACADRLPPLRDEEEDDMISAALLSLVK
ncbi:MarR family winged helix-turn-helix transcriptional regulator [Hellea balneolensis]|uniref:MarR family winged helix-turn-helix transcriptional regulator n=1 Tax=Hellea balneolensis TaxID=287478 RepID=UPI0003F6069E|nr:MarR family transcriptional regulator [Hellea balneolensis]